MLTQIVNYSASEIIETQLHALIDAILKGWVDISSPHIVLFPYVVEVRKQGVAIAYEYVFAPCGTEAIARVEREYQKPPRHYQDENGKLVVSNWGGHTFVARQQAHFEKWAKESYWGQEQKLIRQVLVVLEQRRKDVEYNKEA